LRDHLVDARATSTEGSMQISHIEVRRHPIWQREVHHEHLVAGPGNGTSRRSRLAVVVVVGLAAVVALLVTLA